MLQQIMTGPGNIELDVYKRQMQYRIQKAKELMLTTHLKSYEIAELVGFSDESYFSRCFKKITGMSPNEYRRNK